MTNSSPTPSKKQINPFAKLLMYLFAVPAVGIGEGTKALFRKTYSRNESIIPLIVGAVVALATGIGAGYQAGWVNDLVLWKWVGYGVASATVSFFYLWPLFYLALFQWPFRISEALWKHVNIEGESRRDQPPAWFSTTLIFLGYVAVVAGALYVAYGVDIAVQANQAGWWWLGAILGVLSAILVVVVVIAILGFVGEEMSGGLAFFLFLAMVALTWWFWGPVSGFASGAWNSLTGKDWGNWGYVAGIIPAAISGLVVGGIAGTLLNWLRLRLIAVLTGLAAVYFLTPTTTALVNGIELGSFSLITPALPWAASALALFVYIGLVFPLAHIAVTHGLKRLPDLLDALKEAYDEKNKRYRSFIAQVTTIAAVVAIFWFVPALLTATFGLTALWAVYGLTSLAAIAVYLVGGNLLDNTGIGPQGLAISIAAGYFTFHWSIALSFGTVASSFIGTAAGMFTFLLAFPLAYVVVRFVADPLLASWLAEPLVKLNHKAAISFMDLVESLTEAADRTYGDKTPYAPTFLHLVNLVSTAGAAFGTFVLTGSLLGFAPWLTIASTVLCTGLSYLLVGKLLQKVGVFTVGLIAGVTGGVFVGSFAHAAQPYGLWVAVPVGLVGAALSFGLAFPIAYLVLRSLINVTQPQSWLKPLVEGAHDWCWKRFTNSWEDFKKVYREVRDAFQPTWQSLRDTYEEVATSLRQMFSGGKPDDKSEQKHD